MDIEEIRLALRERRGQWVRIAASAGISRKTIERLMADDQYNPTVATLRAIAGALPGMAGTELISHPDAPTVLTEVVNG